MDAPTPGVASGDVSDAQALLQRIRSPDFDLFECVATLAATANNVGIQFVLCERLAKYPPEKVAFYLAQLVQIFVTVETESAALEDFLLSLCNASTHVTLVVFWQLTAALSDLAEQPRSYGFGVAKRLYNKLQYVLFALGDPPETAMRENPQPGMVLAAMVAASIGVPHVGSIIKPLVLSQGRRQRSEYLHRVIARFKRPSTPPGDPLPHHSSPEPEHRTVTGQLGARSMPNLVHSSPEYNADVSLDAAADPTVGYHSAAIRLNGDLARTPPSMRLRMHYFRNEAQFLYSLQSISNRLLQVPKQARLSALQLELALLNRDLPAEVDLPMLMPSTKSGKQNRIVRINPSEATVLNSAEKAPFLLLIEYLRGDLTFDPTTKRNRQILTARNPPPLFERTVQKRDTPIQNVERGSGVDSSTEDSDPAADEEDIARISLVELDEMSSYHHSPHRMHPREGTRTPREMPVTQDELDAAAGIAEQAGALDIADLATQMRTAEIILAQLDGAEGSRGLPRSEVATIKTKIVDLMQGMQNHHALIQGEAGERKLENDLKTAGLSAAAAVDDPSAANLGEDWQARKTRIRKSSPFGHDPRWDLFSVIVKTGDDLRQESLACQIIQRSEQIWKEAGVGVWTKRMRILITSANSGLVETITNGLSLHSIKKALTTANVSNGGDPRQIAPLHQHFELKFGPRDSPRFRQALHNFVRSLAAYSLLTYLLQIKDRHNGNILVDNEGHIIHIDFGFMLSNAPGHISFEAAPFKLTHEYVDLMGGTTSEWYTEYVTLMQQAFRALRHHSAEFVSFVEIMAKDSKLPCFLSGPATATALEQRFMNHLTDAELDTFVVRLVSKSFGSIYTRMYDQFQLVTQGIYS